MHFLLHEFDVLGSPKIISLKEIRNYQNIPELKTPRWVKIGKVASLHIYPLISGKAYAVDECYMTSQEIKMYKKGRLIKWDRLVQNSSICFLNKLPAIVRAIIS